MGLFQSLLPFCAKTLIKHSYRHQLCYSFVLFFTHNGSISTLQVGLVIDVHNGGQEILRTDEGTEGWYSCVFIFGSASCRENVWLTDKVFPEPVWAMPTMSLPLRARGNPCAWMAVGSLKFCCIRTSMTYSVTKHRGHFNGARWLATAERLE